MKKLFLTICFSIIGWQIIDASAKTVAFEDMEAAQAYKASQDNLPPPPPEDDSPDPRDTRAMEKYIMEKSNHFQSGTDGFHGQALLGQYAAQR